MFKVNIKIFILFINLSNYFVVGKFYSEDYLRNVYEKG